MNNRIPLIAGNWKMNLDHLQAIANVQKLSWSLEDANHNFDQVEVAVFPPFTDLRSVQSLIAADRLDIKLGAQDVSPHEKGAFTGDVSAPLLKKLDVDYVIVGHSERRIGHLEDDNLVTSKALAALKSDMVPVICVGETDDDLELHGPGVTAVKQLEIVLTKITNKQEFIIAYEPVWAIGTGKAATPDDAETVCTMLRSAIEEKLGKDAADNTRILYGGSVTSLNVATYLREANIDGVLVGGASLKPDEFSKIAQFKKHVVA